MTPAALRVGQVNATIRVTLHEAGTPLDVSAAAVKRLKFQRPDGTLLERDAAFTTDGADGVIEYVTVDEDDLTVAGPWIGQPYVELGADRFHGSMFSFQVGEVVL